MRFDTVLVVDWSGGNDRGVTPKKDAIWAGIWRNGASEPPTYLRNRHVAETWLVEFLNSEEKAGNKVCVGFDFPFGYPQGFAKALAGDDDPFAVWDWFEAHIEDAPDTNNRFDLAGQINLDLTGGAGPFWFNGLKRKIAGLSSSKPASFAPFPEKRACEKRAKGSFSCWQMGGGGAVGGQVFMGLPVVNRLRRQFDVAVWPFEPLTRQIALVEVWPSLTLGRAPEDQIKDAWQVSEVARQIGTLSEQVLEQVLDVEASHEGWILGLGHEHVIRGATPALSNDCFALPAGVHWTPVEEALASLRDRLSPIAAVETLTLERASGRIAARDHSARRANPPLPNTAVDGYGFEGARGDGLHEIPLTTGRAAAGDTPVTLPSGQAIRVLTGAALPQGVDTVVLQEDVSVEAGKIRFYGPIKQGSNTRKAGEDVDANAVVLTKGQYIRAPELALLAATGLNDIYVYRPLRVGVLSTGDELVSAGEAANPGQIYDANRPMLLSLMDRFGHEPVDLGHVGDDRAALKSRLDAASETADVIVTSGGASAGDEDHVSALLQEHGNLAHWRIALKPGRPLALGVWQGKPVFGLPGNPVAALVCSLIFARPALSLLAGSGWQDPQSFQVPAAFEKRKRAGRREYLRARIENGRVIVFASEGSGRISGLSWADGLVELPEAAGGVAPGDLVTYIPYASFGLT